MTHRINNVMKEKLAGSLTLETLGRDRDTDGQT